MNSIALGNDEHIVFQTGKHPVVFFKSLALVALWVASFFVDFTALSTLLHIYSSTPRIIFTIFVILYVLNAILNYQFSTCVITNKNIIIRDGYGLLSRDSLNFARTSMLILEVNQNIPGRLLNYGTISVNMLNKPYFFKYIANAKKLMEHFNAS